MEAKEEFTVSNLSLKGDQVPTISDNSRPNPNPNIGTIVPSFTVTEAVKKKRGRPRKYGPDGKLASPLSPMPISSTVPLTGEFSFWKRGRGKPLEPIRKQPRFEVYEPPGNKISYLVGAGFTADVITVKAGEDVSMKIMSFSQQGARAICILSATGTVSNVTLRQSTTSGGTLTYEGHFEILSLTGSYTPTETGGTKSRAGGMSVSLAGPDGQVVGGGLAGLLIAAGPVQVVVGSFLPGHQLEAKPTKPRIEPAAPVAPTTVTVLTAEDLKKLYGGVKPIPVPSSSFHEDDSASPNPSQGFTEPSDDDDDKSSPEGHSEGHEQSNYAVSQ